MLSDPQITAGAGPKQARSIARKQVLLDYGVGLFNARSLDEVSIQDITRAVGFSTGSFYSYFTDKKEYFVAVQNKIAADQDAAAAKVFAPERLADLGLAERLELCVEFAIAYFRKHTGLVQAALSYERRIPAGWQPNRKTTATIIAKATAELPAKETAKLEIAVQLAFGLLVNALLHDPGPLHLKDRNLAAKVTAALTPYLSE